MYPRLLSSIPGLSLLEASSTLPNLCLEQLESISRHYQISWGPNLPLVKNHCSGGNSVYHNLDFDASKKVLKWHFTQRKRYWKKHHCWLHLSPQGTVGAGEGSLWGKSHESVLTRKWPWVGEGRQMGLTLDVKSIPFLDNDASTSRNLIEIYQARQQHPVDSKLKMGNSSLPLAKSELKFQHTERWVDTEWLDI